MDTVSLYELKSLCDKNVYLCPAVLVLSALAKIAEVKDKDKEKFATFLSKCCTEMKTKKYSPTYGLECYMRWKKFLSTNTCGEKEVDKEVEKEFKKLKEVLKWAEKNKLVLTSFEHDADIVHAVFVHPCGYLVVTVWKDGWEVSISEGLKVEGNKVVCGGIPKTTKKVIEELSKELIKEEKEGEEK